MTDIITGPGNYCRADGVKVRIGGTEDDEQTWDSDHGVYWQNGHSVYSSIPAFAQQECLNTSWLCARIAGAAR